MGFTTRKNYRTFLYVNTLVIVLLGAVVAGGGVFILFPANLGQDYHSALAAVQAIRKVLLWKVAVIYTVISFLILLTIAVLHLIYSHRVAGPAYRIGCEAAKIAQGNLACDFNFRRNDNLTDMKDFLNDVGCRYRFRIIAIMDSLAIVETQSGTVSELIRRGEGGVALRQAVEEITENVKNIEGSLWEIKT